MKEIPIEYLAYLLREAKQNNKPQPIFFLGAGASRSGNIPLTQEIIGNVLKKYSDSPYIRDLKVENRTYPNLMECLTPMQRNELLKEYINEAKINVTHIYLAQLLQEGYVDYILTVNFDNLVLRALALFNIFPSTYDMAILKDLTTTTFKEKSVVYLHGQSHGLWLLNTIHEMNKVGTILPRIFDSIKNGRPWIFIGYSGEDPVFEHIKKMGRFDNGFYWIAYKDENPKQRVEEFISDPYTNAFIIRGYDSDSFMLKLNSELKLGQPSIIDKPFTALQEMLEEIVDIEEKDHFKGVKERLEIVKRQVKDSIQKYELENISFENEAIEVADFLKKELINMMINEDYDQEKISRMEIKIKEIGDNKLSELLAIFYYSWGNFFLNSGVIKEKEHLYKQAIEKYKQAICINPDMHEIYNNWGTVLMNLGKIKKGKETEQLYQEAAEKYKQAIRINPHQQNAYTNLGTVLKDLGKLKEGEEAEQLYQKAAENYKQAIRIDPALHEAYYNWGTLLMYLGQLKEGEEAEQLYQQAIEKYEQAIQIKPNKHQAYTNWGGILIMLGKIKKGEEAEQLYQQAIEKYEKAIQIKPDKHQAYTNWGHVLVMLGETKEREEAEKLYKKAKEKYKQADQIKSEINKKNMNKNV